MHQPRKWWIGLPVLAGLIFFATQSLTPRIEAELRSRVAARLSIDPAQIDVSGRDVTISGLASLSRERPLAALRDEPGLRRVTETGDSAAVVAHTPAAEPSKPSAPREPYVFSATLGASLVALDGKLPDDALRKRAVALASTAGAGLAVSDGTKIDADPPSGDYAAALGVALDALGSLAQGNVTLSGGRLSIEGKGRANVRAESIAADVRARLPQGFELVKVEVSPGPVSPFVFEADRKAATTTLTGFVPDEGSRARLIDGARRRFYDSKVEDRLVVAQGAPPKFTEAAEAALAALARLDEGKLSLADAKLSVSGRARYDGARAEIAASLDEHLPTSFKSDVTLATHTLGAPLEAAGCRAAFAELSRTPVLFDADDAAISDESAALLDGMTATILRCATVPIEVAGHTDDQGIAEINRDRSKRRARLVVEKFVKAGADSFHVWAMGYGGERPVAPNDSDENRARNRRIEFIVK